MSKSVIEIKKEVTESVIESLENGVKPWICPWSHVEFSWPKNTVTGHTYQGINILLLWQATFRDAYARQEWVTYAQAKKSGKQVKKGEKGTTCVFYKLVEFKESDDPDQTDDKVRRVPMLKRFKLFNVEQLDDFDQSFECMPKLNGMNILRGYISAEDIQFRQGGNRAFYRQATDLIAMPLGDFDHDEHYLATLAHECIHSSASKQRTGREEYIRDKFDPLSVQAYAFEELVAELGAAMLCAYFGVKGEHLQHADYVGSWLKALRGDNSYIFKASSLAWDAVLYILNSVGIDPLSQDDQDPVCNAKMESVA